MTFRFAVAAAILTATVMSISDGRAQQYPSRPVTIVVPLAAGTGIVLMVVIIGALSFAQLFFSDRLALAAMAVVWIADTAARTGHEELGAEVAIEQQHERGRGQHRHEEYVENGGQP